MKTFIIFCSLLVLFMGQAQAADCDEAGNPDDGEFKNFFKTLGCKVKQGAEDVAEAAKPYTKKIGEGAQSLGASVSKQYDELKHRLVDTPASSAPLAAAQYDAPTERVPLAPIAPSVPADVVANSQPIAA